jgi:hypothetical protein
MFSEIMVIGSIGLIAYGLYEKSNKKKNLENLTENQELEEEIKICPGNLTEKEKEKKIKEKLLKYKTDGYEEIKREVKDDGFLYITVHNSLKNKLKKQVDNATGTTVIGAILLIVFGYFSLSSEDKPKITSITLKDFPMIEVCFNKPLRNYYGMFIMHTKNGKSFSNSGYEMIIDTELHDDINHTCDDFNPYNYLTNRWTTSKELKELDKNLKWSNIKSITFALYEKKDDLRSINVFTKKY